MSILKGYMNDVGSLVIGDVDVSEIKQALKKLFRMHHIGLDINHTYITYYVQN